MAGVSRLFWAALLLWLLILIATPIGLWISGEGAFPLLASLGVLAQASATLLALRKAKPWNWIVRMMVAVALFAWGVEWLGSTTGFPFGSYVYSGRLQPQLLGVPLIIPLAWWMMLVPAWGMSEMILGRRRQPLLFAALAAVVFTAWDLYLDPQMVAHSLWLWQTPGEYFGIPWVNYAGWWLAAFLLTLLLRPNNLPQQPLRLIYTLTWAFQAVGLGIFWGQPGPALAGCLGMGVFVAAAFYPQLARIRLPKSIRQSQSAPSASRQ